jgi:hypothetical protein
MKQNKDRGIINISKTYKEFGETSDIQRQGGLHSGVLVMSIAYDAFMFIW